MPCILSPCPQVLHTEIMFDPQAHTERGVAFSSVINGIHRAMSTARTDLGITSCLIMNFLRHLDEASALHTLRESLPHRDKITAVGLDSTELNIPPTTFQRVCTVVVRGVTVHSSTW